MEENVIQINGGIKINFQFQCKKHQICDKNYIWNPATCICKNGKYLQSITADAVIKCDEIIDADAQSKPYEEETTTIPKNIICETKSSHI